MFFNIIDVPVRVLSPQTRPHFILQTYFFRFFFHHPPKKSKHCLHYWQLEKIQKLKNTSIMFSFKISCSELEKVCVGGVFQLGGFFLCGVQKEINFGKNPSQHKNVNFPVPRFLFFGEKSRYQNDPDGGSSRPGGFRFSIGGLVENVIRRIQ